MICFIDFLRHRFNIYTQLQNSGWYCFSCSAVDWQEVQKNNATVYAHLYFARAGCSPDPKNPYYDRLATFYARHCKMWWCCIPMQSPLCVTFSDRKSSRNWYFCKLVLHSKPFFQPGPVDQKWPGQLSFGIGFVPLFLGLAVAVFFALYGIALIFTKLVIQHLWLMFRSPRQTTERAY